MLRRGEMFSFATKEEINQLVDKAVLENAKKKAIRKRFVLLTLLKLCLDAQACFEISA